MPFVLPLARFDKGFWRRTSSLRPEKTYHTRMLREVTLLTTSSLYDSNAARERRVRTVSSGADFKP